METTQALELVNSFKLLKATGIAVTLSFLMFLAGRSLSDATKEEASIVPDSKFRLFDFFDCFLEGFIKFQDSILGKENRKYTGLCFSVFTFVFSANILGLVPYLDAYPATTTVVVNLGIILVVFFAFNYYSIKEHGLFGFFQHFFVDPKSLCNLSSLKTIPLFFIGLVIFFIEIISMLLRVLTLNLRLYWNITADHMVLNSFVELTKWVIPVIFYGLGVFVSFMQAFIFTILTMVYILLAVQHAEED